MSDSPSTPPVERRFGSLRHRAARALRYGAAVAAVVLAALLTAALRRTFDGAPNSLLICAIILSSWFGGFGPGLLATVLSVLAIKLCFTSGAHDLAFSAGEIPRFTVLFLAGLFISWLGDRQRDDEAALLRARDELEEKVRARTLALTTANEHLTREKKTAAELGRVARATTMGELTASIAHEVNQPLAAVVTNANAALRWLAADPPNFDETRQSLRSIVRDGTRAGEVIARIRALLRKAEWTPRALSIDELIREIAALTRAEAERRGVTLELALAPDLPPVRGDRVQLQQVLLNLVMNALDAVSAVPNGARRVRLRTSEAPEPHTVLVAVEDSGIGLDTERAGRLFEAFYTTKPDGLGMGLSISRSIVETHGGRLWATPNHGAGATFQFTLPTAARPEA